MRWTVPLVASAATVLLAACSTGTQAPPSSTSIGVDRAAAQVAMMADAPAPHAPVPGATPGGRLTVEYGGSPASLDPSQAYGQDAERILHLTSRSLTAFTLVDGRSVLVPDLATDLGRVSADGLTWTFTLRPGLRYSDGSSVRAADVVYAIQRSFAHAELPGGPTYQNQYLAGGDTYKGPWASKDADFRAASAPDERTVVIRLAKKMPALPFFASFSQFSPIPKAKDTRTAYAAQALATGPYVIDRYTPDSGLTLRHNPHWDPATDPARTRYVDGYRFVFNAEDVVSQTAVLASNGEAARTLNWDPVDATLAAAVRGDKQDRLVTGPGICTVVVNLDTRKIPLDVRRAIAVAYPFDQVRTASGESALSSTPASGLLMEQVPGYSDAVLPGVRPGRGTGDPAAARAMLAKAGKSGFTLTWYQGEDPSTSRASLVLAEAMRAAGFTVKTLSAPMQQLDALRANPSGPHNMLQSPSGWCYDWPTGDAVFAPTLASDTIRSGATGWGNLDDPQVDAEIARISALPLDEAAPEWTRFERWLLTTRLPVLPWIHDRATTVFGTKVHGVVIDPAKGMPALDRIWVDTTG